MWSGCRIAACNPDFFPVNGQCLDRCASGVGPFVTVQSCSCPGARPQLCYFDELQTPQNGRCEISQINCVCARETEVCLL
jgi:hypothetical protein